MKIQLIDGGFTKADAIEILTKMINVKIAYHENHIAKTDMEEDIKWRESKIKRLQNQLIEIRSIAHSSIDTCKINAEIKIQ